MALRSVSVVRVQVPEAVDRTRRSRLDRVVAVVRIRPLAVVVEQGAMRERESEVLPELGAVVVPQVAL